MPELKGKNIEKWIDSLVTNFKKRGAKMKFQWLKDYKDIENQILYLKWNLDKSKLELERWEKGELANVRLEKNSRSFSLKENIEKIEQEIKRLEDQKEELLSIILSFKGIDNDIVRLKYIDGYTLEKIAEEIRYSASYVRQRHAEIRKTISFIDGYNGRNEHLLKND